MCPPVSPQSPRVATDPPVSGSERPLPIAVPKLAIEEFVFEGPVITGGMGVVHKAMYRQGAHVAVKQLLDSPTKQDYDLFVKEIQQHFSIPPFPHIVQVGNICPPALPLPM